MSNFSALGVTGGGLSQAFLTVGGAHRPEKVWYLFSLCVRVGPRKVLGLFCRGLLFGCLLLVGCCGLFVVCCGWLFAVCWVLSGVGGWCFVVGVLLVQAWLQKTSNHWSLFGLWFVFGCAF